MTSLWAQHMSSPTEPIRLITAAYAEEAGLDTAVSAALLRRVGDGEVPETLRLYRPGREVAFGRQDVAASGYRAAVAAAVAAGFVAIERLAGGRAAVFTPGTIAFSWTIPHPDPRATTQQRFRMVAGLLRDALQSLDIDARVGEVPGEYCPGRFSISAGGRLKLVGVGQRLTRHAAHVGGLVVVAGSAELRAVLQPVYAALELEWRPAVTGAIVDVAPAVTFDDAFGAIIETISAQRPLLEATIDATTLGLARRMAPDYLS
jgi:lipoate-protein ligase A